MLFTIHERQKELVFKFWRRKKNRTRNWLSITDVAFAWRVRISSWSAAVIFSCFWRSSCKRPTVVRDSSSSTVIDRHSAWLLLFASVRSLFWEAVAASSPESISHRRSRFSTVERRSVSIFCRSARVSSAFRSACNRRCCSSAKSASICWRSFESNCTLRSSAWISLFLARRVCSRSAARLPWFVSKLRSCFSSSALLRQMEIETQKWLLQCH